MQTDAVIMGLPLKRVRGLARELDASDFGALWFTEGGRTAYLGCTVTALATERLQMGTGIAVAFPRSPMVTAQVAWELAEASGGRFVLGLGTQVKAHMQRRYATRFDHPGSRLREYVLALRAIFRAFQGEEKLDFHGRFWSFDLLPDTWNPGPIEHPRVPVYVAGVNPWMARMAGEVADGLHVNPFHSLRYIREVLQPAIREGASRAGRSPEDIKLVCPVLTIVGDTEEERERWRQLARFQLAFYGSTRNYAGVFDLHGWEGTSERLHALQRAGDLRGMAENHQRRDAGGVHGHRHLGRAPAHPARPLRRRGRERDPLLFHHGLERRSEQARALEVRRGGHCAPR